MKSLKQPGKRDLVIPVMGATGAGKSSFINTLLKQKTMTVGNDLKSCTGEVSVGYVETIEGHPDLKDFRIVLVDTPGFDDTYEADFSILEKIASWLKDSYKRGATLGGVIYLHDISAPRFTGTARRNLQMFRSLCGEDVLDHVVFGTTKWDLRVPGSKERHNQLADTYWKPLLDKGAGVLRFDNNHQSAFKFIQRLISSRTQAALDQTVLQIQRELVDDKLILPETKASAELRFTLQEVLEIQKKLQRLNSGGDDDLQVQQKEAREKINLLHSQLKNLKVPLSRRVRKFFSF